ncbi:hypothetical protein BTZ05_24785 [Vibrio parahaemolyticus]|uniref:AAA family ATPase n=1 Tax=Vibrio parahaemolyticus TaxID=670 RepID=UPI000A35FB41|nr:AAA family ATPase [Vibrio parahaemolyticus]MDF4337007.1 AAA family ATPase [Vibrio parahaemolyticus]OUJ37249.1 hypothetical protein BTZ05_24785 [Vibrio parahaemolyticus]OUJ38118.1 hypothetical protein BTR40_00665 [Vibrio parahaemolyticus]
MNDVIERVKLARLEHGLTQRAIARESGVNEGSLSALLKHGTCAGDKQSYLKKLEMWLNNRDHQQETRSTLASPAFLELPTAKRIMNLMSIAQNLSSWSMVYEGAGVGKTKAAEEYQRTHNNVWIVTASPFCKTSAYVIGELAEQLGVRGCRTIATQTKAVAKELVGRNGLVIIDEAQYLSDDTLNGIRILIEGKAGGMLLGNDVVRTRMTATRSKVNMKAFWSRVISPAMIKHPVPDDIDMFVRAWGVTDAEILRYAQRITPQTEGQLRSLDNILKLASSRALSSGEPLNVEHVKRAHQKLAENLRG